MLGLKALNSEAGLELFSTLPKSEHVDAVEKDPPHFENGLTLKQPSHDFQNRGNKSPANLVTTSKTEIISQRALVSLGDSDLII